MVQCAERGQWFACSSHLDFYLYFKKNCCRGLTDAYPHEQAVQVTFLSRVTHTVCAMDMDFKETPCPTASIIAFSEVGFRAGIPRPLFLAKICLDRCPEGRARVSHRHSRSLAPQPCRQPGPGWQSLGVPRGMPGAAAPPRSALVG